MSVTAGPITGADPKAAVSEWFARLGRYCASVDYDSTRAIFAPDVVSFGTRADIVSSLDHLQKNQWEGIWPNIQDFKIDLDSIHAGGDDHVAWGVATWTSTGFHEDGDSFFRPGRATVILERRNGEWLSVHTHFSLNPGTPPRTYGPR
jgi:ketosteroid isomerase-like protein